MISMASLKLVCLATAGNQIFTIDEDNGINASLITSFNNCAFDNSVHNLVESLK